jgi:hypothetical protein
VIGNLIIVEFSGAFSFLSYFSLVVLASWSECLLLGILLGLSHFACSRGCISSCYLVLEFSFIYIENTKNTFFSICILAFSLLVV